jgi:ATP phosphoribosyltransferase regulatory subunit
MISVVRLPAGVRDFLPRAAARRRSIAERLLVLFENWGYQRIITPVFECADVLERGLGADGREEAIRFVEPGTGEIVALRPDFTPQVARIAATRMLEPRGPLRLCYEGAVHRLAGPRGQREILQAGVELIDAAAPGGDAEAIALASAVLGSLDLADTSLDIGHVAPARAVLDHAGEARDMLFEALARKDRSGVGRAAAVVPKQWRPLAEALPRLWGPADRVMAQARALPWPAPVQAALDELDAAISAAGVPVTVDLGEVRGFEYYTGLRVAGYARGVGDAILRGGRYDELVARYGRAAPAVGFAVDIENIAQAQRAHDVAPPPSVTILVCGANAGAVAATLRAAGLRAAVDLGTAADRTAYARAAGFARVVELDGTTATITNLDGSAAATCAVAELASQLGRRP